MIEERAIKTHLIITDIHSEYDIDWCGHLIDTHPRLKNGKPIFIICNGDTRIEMNTLDFKYLEEVAKRAAQPKGRRAIERDTVRIYLLEDDDNEVLMGKVTQKRIKTFAPMFDKVGYIG